MRSVVEGAVRTLVASLTLLFLALPAFAEQVQVSADGLQIIEAEKQAIFTGSVVITRTGMTLTAQKVIVFYEGGVDDIRSFDATGSVRIVTEGQTATGQRAQYDPATQILRLTGNVLVQNAAGTMGGAELTVNLATNDTVFRSGDGQRVTGVFTPQ